MTNFIANLNEIYSLEKSTITFLRENMVIKNVSKNDIILKKKQN